MELPMKIQASSTDTEDRMTPAGTQTLMRGLAMLELVAQSHDGVSIQHVADHVGVHRTIATRALQALGEYNLVRRGGDGRFRIGAGAVAMGRQYLTTLREAARPILEQLATSLQSSACLFVVDGDAAVAVMVIEPDDTPFHVTFKTGSRHPLDRGSAGYAIAALKEPASADPAPVVQARDNGFAVSEGEVEPGAWGVSVALQPALIGVEACVHMTTFRREVAEKAAPTVLAAARQIETIVSGT